MINKIGKLFRSRYISLLTKASKYSTPTACSNCNSDVVKKLLQHDKYIDPIHLSRFYVLGKIFCDYAVAVEMFISNNDAQPSELATLQKRRLVDTKRQLKQLELSYQGQTVDSIALLNRFKALDIHCEYWNLSFFENINEMTDECLQLLVNWRVNVVQLETDEREQMCKRIVGAYSADNRSRQALLFLAWLGIPILPLTKNSSNELKYGKWTVSPTDDSMEIQRNVNALLIGYSSVETAIGYSFYNRKYLLEAVTHSSCPANTLTPSNNRLAFLGNRVLVYTSIKCMLDHSNSNNWVTINNILVANSVNAVGRRDFRTIDGNIDRVAHHLKFRISKQFAVNFEVTMETLRK